MSASEVLAAVPRSGDRPGKCPGSFVAVSPKVRADPPCPKQIPGASSTKSTASEPQGHYHSSANSLLPEASIAVVASEPRLVFCSRVRGASRTGPPRAHRLRPDKNDSSPGQDPGLLPIVNERFGRRCHVSPHDFLCERTYLPRGGDTNMDTQTRMLDDFTGEIALYRRLSYPLERR